MLFKMELLQPLVTAWESTAQGWESTPKLTLGFTFRLRYSSLSWFTFRILQGNPKKERQRSLWVGLNPTRKASVM